jgi:predicted GH43/DUF377 family glycosyl hydrolase
MHSYAQVPRCVIGDESLEILFATRSPADADGSFVSRIGSVKVSIQEPTRVLSVSSHPVLDLGEVGAFDEFGVMPGCVIQIGGTDYLYYTGWSRPLDAPYRTFIGLAARSHRRDTFSRHFKAPLLGPTENEPILCNGPFVLEANGKLHMWYASALRWIEHNGRTECEYRIVHAASDDGLNWNRDGVFIVPQRFENECQNAPTVIQIGDRFHMWFCCRETLGFREKGRGYRLGYAWSENLVEWHRDDAWAGLNGPTQNWDNEMQCYPGVYQVGEQLLMYYSGNYFGRDGFGCAMSTASAIS